MFRYKVKLKQATDPKMGLGLFADEFISGGSVVWKFIEGVDLKIHKDKIEKLNDVQKLYFNTYAWIKGDYYFLSCDLTNFINHSKTPNVSCMELSYCVATNDINIGDEIFENYGEFDDCFNEYKNDLF
jgi:hypothetical protein